MPLTSKEKQSELQRHRDILLTTLDYLLSKFTGSFICDGVDFMTDYYQQQKLQTEKYFKQRRLDPMQQHLHTLTSTLRITDLDFAGYIKENTGYDLPLVEASISIPEAKGRRSEIISEVFEGDLVTTSYEISFGSKRKPYPKYEVVSPDGRCKLLISESGTGKNASTSVSIFFNAGNGPLFAIVGNISDIRVYWKDNSTVLIESKKDCTILEKHKKVQSFHDSVKIEYVEI